MIASAAFYINPSGYAQRFRLVPAARPLLEICGTGQFQRVLTEPFTYSLNSN